MAKFSIVLIEKVRTENLRCDRRLKTGHTLAGDSVKTFSESGKRIDIEDICASSTWNGKKGKNLTDIVHAAVDARCLFMCLSKVTLFTLSIFHGVGFHPPVSCFREPSTVHTQRAIVAESIAALRSRLFYWWKNEQRHFTGNFTDILSSWDKKERHQMHTTHTAGQHQARLSSFAKKNVSVVLIASNVENIRERFL